MKRICLGAAITLSLTMLLTACGPKAPSGDPPVSSAPAAPSVQADRSKLSGGPSSVQPNLDGAGGMRTTPTI